ncbi:putative serine/threonine-protein kinase PBL9 isoform X2 [Bidens hawaiensis]|uniref:putative serine/threonine-protein kinase PBL9 isoform X2 n=1 Tax=Bidens hawaiensis TaxID=980011 RepID=UPI004049B935
MGQISKKCLKEFASMAVQCLHFQPKQRPTMAEVVVKLESILLRERERNGSGVDDGRFINKVRYLFTSKAELMPARAEENKAEIIEQYIQKSVNRKIRTYTEEDVFYSYGRTIYGVWVDEFTYAPSEPGVGLAVCVETRHISELVLKSEEFDHPNLPKLLGYYLNRKELFCVYEINPSLDKLLFVGTCSLSWVERLNIAVGAAQGLFFLHKKGRPAYTQFKTTCIMVDADYYARLQDFEVDISFEDPISYSFERDARYSAPEWFRYQADIIVDGFEHCFKD